jgi:hypothetical protein
VQVISAAVTQIDISPTLDTGASKHVRHWFALGFSFFLIGAKLRKIEIRKFEVGEIK